MTRKISIRLKLSVSVSDDLFQSEVSYLVRYCEGNVVTRSMHSWIAAIVPEVRQEKQSFGLD